MKIAILSGKGGTGKTTVSVNLFSKLEQAVLIDTDVEEPNSHLFLDLTENDRKEVYKEFPVVNADACTLCGACGEFCNFNAIMPTKKNVVVFDDLCHDCGGCKLVCSEHAIDYGKKSIGNIITTKTSQEKTFIYGDLNVGEVSGIKLIETLKDMTKDESMVIIDSPPGTACSTVAAIQDVDYAIIVAEPTPFGLSDMKMVVELLRDEHIPFGVVVNKSQLGDNSLFRYLEMESIPLIAHIPFDEVFAKLYAKGENISNSNQIFSKKIDDIINYLNGVKL